MPNDDVEQANIDDPADKEVNVEKEEWNRRKFMKAGSAAAGTGLLMSASGCTSSSGGGSGSGNSGDNNTGNGGTSKGSQSNADNAQIILAPTGFQGIIMDHIAKDTNILSKEFDKANLDTSVSRSWESAAIFTSGGADFGTLGSLEAAKLAGERDLPLQVNANIAPQFMCTVGATGGPYDPDKTGGPQASMDKLHKTQDRYVLGGWGGGTGIMMPLIVSEAFGYTFADDDSSDFENITTADYSAVPKLVQDDKAVMGTSSPLHGAAPAMAPKKYDGDSAPIKTLWQLGGIMNQLDNFSAPQLNSWTCSQKFANRAEAAPKAIVQAFQKGVDWFYKDPIGRVGADDKHLKQLGLESMDQARYVVDWGINLELDNDLQVIYDDISLNEKFVENDKNFLSSAQKTGFLTKNWENNIQYALVKSSAASTSTNGSSMTGTKTNSTS